MPFQGIPRVVVAAIAAGLVCQGASTLDAQRANSPQPEMYRLNLVTVKRGMMPDFIKFQAAEMVPALKKGGIPARMVWTSGEFGETHRLAAFVPVKDMAQYDGPSPLVAALGEGAAALNARNASFTESNTYVLVRTRPDLSYVPDPKAPPAALAVVSEVEVMGGRRQDFEATLKKEVLPLMQQAKVRSYSVLEVVLGGNVGTYYTSIGYDSYAALGKGHPFEVVVGPGGSAKIEAKFTGIVKNLTRTVVRFNPDLSFTTAPGTSN
jgi:hypothetical protein